MTRRRGNQLVQQLQPLRRQPPRSIGVTPVTLPPGRFRLATSPSCDRIAAGGENDRNCRGRGLGGEIGRSTGRAMTRAPGAERGPSASCRQTIVLILRPAIFDRHILALDIAGFLQALTECGHLGCKAGSGDPLLRNPTTGIAGCCARAANGAQQRCRRRAAEKRYELAPPHSITRLASASRFGGMSSPIAFAVLRLRISSNVVGCTIGRSAGLAPFNILSTRTAPTAKSSW